MLFDFIKRKKKSTSESAELSEAAKQWNKMWELWTYGMIESPYDELMNYHSEVFNGGHYQYFLNTESNGDIQKEMEALGGILPDELKDNMLIAFKSYLELEQDKNIDRNENTIKKCDGFFWENEKIINEILISYCNQL